VTAEVQADVKPDIESAFAATGEAEKAAHTAFGALSTVQGSLSIFNSIFSVLTGQIDVAKKAAADSLNEA